MTPHRGVVWVASFLLILSLLPSATTAAVGSADAGDAPPPVIAYLDTGINPYHEAFRAPNWTDHPSTYIPGYPEDAQALNLTLDADSFEEAWEADQDAWAAVEKRQLYYVPGTRIVGMISFKTTNTTGAPELYDTAGHGTMVADAGSGEPRGTAPDSAIVMIQGGDGEHEWVRDERWIDVLSRSLGRFAGVSAGPVDGWWRPSHEIAEGGRSVVQAGGNGPVNGGVVNILGADAGPPWVFTVGQALGQGSRYSQHRACEMCSRPWEAMAVGPGRYAVTDSFDETEQAAGTSFAAPKVAGYLARLVADARERLGDTGNVHTHPGVYARADGDTPLPDRGPLADGVLNRTEAEDAVRRTAASLEVRFGQLSGPHPGEASYWYQGYGLVNDTTHDHARRVLLGDEPMPDRPRDDRWHERFDRIAAAYWEPWVCFYQAGGDVTEYPGCWAEQVPGLAG